MCLCFVLFTVQVGEQTEKVSKEKAIADEEEKKVSLGVFTRKDSPRGHVCVVVDF